MYSIVLMAAMVTTPEVPDFGRKRGHDCGQMECGGCGSSCGHHGKKHHGGGCGESCGHSCGGCGSACGGCGASAPTAPDGRPMPPPTLPKPTGALSPTSATVVVLGAADAQVTIGGLVSASTADMRVMVSPTLDAGQTYYYDLTAESQGVRLTQAVSVRAGVMTEVNLDFAGRTVVMK